MSSEMDAFVEGMVNKCIRLYDTGKNEEALQCVIDTEKKYKSDAILFYKGIFLAELGRSDEAMSTFDELIKKDPTNPYNYGMKGLQMMKAGKLDDALTYFKIALKFNPGNVELNILASVCTSTNSKTIDPYLAKAADIDPLRAVQLMKVYIDGLLKNAEMTNEERMKLIGALAKMDKELKSYLETVEKIKKTKKKK